MYGLAFWFSMVLLVFMYAVTCYQDGGFWPSQILEKWHTASLPLIAHEGFWGDLILLPIWSGIMVDRFGSEWLERDIVIGSWSIPAILFMAMLGVILTGLNHLMCIQGDSPDPFGWKGEKCSATIAFHYVYMSAMLAVVGLFYFESSASTATIVASSILLGIHMLGGGSHIFLGLLKRWMDWTWCSDYLSNPVSQRLPFVIWPAIIALATIAGGRYAGMAVGVGAVILWIVIRFAVQLAPVL